MHLFDVALNARRALGRAIQLYELFHSSELVAFWFEFGVHIPSPGRTGTGRRLHRHEDQDHQHHPDHHRHGGLKGSSSHTELAAGTLVSMKIADLNEFAANAKLLTDRAKSTGPRSVEGKLRSSLNAVRHGLASKNLLLPGEDVESYESRMDGVFTALAPTDEAQAQLTALVADDLFKLERLGRIEQGIVLGRVEELLGLTQAADRARSTASALVSLGTTIRTWEAQPFPEEKCQNLTALLGAMNDALEQVQSLVPHVQADLIDDAIEVLNQLFNSVGTVTVNMPLVKTMIEKAGRLMVGLLDVGARDEGAQQELRAAIATIALPDEAELKKLGRYRKILEEGLHRRLLSLEQLRKLAATSPATKETTEKAREYRVKLRVVA